MKGRAVAIVAGAILAVVLVWFLLAPPPDEVAPEPVVQPTPSEEAASDPLADELDLLRQEAGRVEPRAEGAERTPDGETFIAHAREIADEALAERRPDVSAAVGDILVEVGEVDFAGAVLQRAVGKMKPDASGKDHVYALARVRRAQRRPLEAASLYERAVHVAPTSAAEFVGLSDHYLASARPGPARAAVTRGLREHPDSRMLAVQGAEVAMLSDELDQALTAADEVLAADPSDFGARLVRLETLLAQGQLEQVSVDAAALRDQVPEDAWGWIFGAAVERAQGGEGTDLLEKAREIAGDCPCTREERLAIEWATAVQAGANVAPRVREDLAVLPASSPATPAP